MTLTKIGITACIAVAATVLGGCSGRWSPQTSLADPTCASDGSVVFYEYPNSSGNYDGLTNSPANCSWNRRREFAG